MSKLLNITQLCEFFGVSRSTIYEWLKQGRLPPPVKKWGSPRWDESQIRQVLKGDSTPRAGTG
jgi:predicted DNA-binding transcriptional regulator AlpA